jgi:hypothetical protein
VDLNPNHEFKDFILRSVASNLLFGRELFHHHPTPFLRGERQLLKTGVNTARTLYLWITDGLCRAAEGQNTQNPQKYRGNKISVTVNKKAASLG